MEPITGVAGSSRRKTTDARRPAAMVFDPSSNIAVHRHVRFWDRTNKGYITPIDTTAGFMKLGYNVILSLALGTLLTALLSYATQDSWIPDPRCRVNVQQMMMRSKRRHRHHHPDVDEYGHFDALFDKYAQSDLSGNAITLSEVLQMANDYNGDGPNPAAWARAVLEWAGIYLLIGKGGVFKKSDVQAAFDGSLFFRLCDSNLKGGAGTLTTDRKEQQKGSILALFPQAAVRLIEKQLNAGLRALPRSASDVLERRVQGWLSGEMDEDDVRMSKSRLTGVSPYGFEHQPRRSQQKSAGLVQERLSGTKQVSLDKQSFALTGVQGYHGPDLPPDGGLAGPISDRIILTGLSPDGLDYYRETPVKDWIGSSSHLAGVHPSQYGPVEPAADEPSAMTSTWLVQDPDGGDDSKNRDDEVSIYHEIMKAFTLSGLLPQHASEAEKKAIRIVELSDMEDHCDTLDKSLTGLDDDGDYSPLPIVRFPTAATAAEDPASTSVLTGIRNEILFSFGMHSLPIVEDQSQPKGEIVVFEPVVLSGLRTGPEGEEEAENVTQPHSLLSIVEAPTAERDQRSFAGLEPVSLSGLRGHSPFFVQEPAGYLPGLDEEQASSDEEPSTPTNREPVALTGIRPVPADVDLALPVPLSGLRTDRAYAGFVEYTGFVQEPKDDCPPHLEPGALSGIRADREYTGLVDDQDLAPAEFDDHPPKKHTSLSGLARSLDNTIMSHFVEAPAFPELCSPTSPEPADLSGLLHGIMGQCGVCDGPGLFTAPIALSENIHLTGTSKRKLENRLNMGVLEGVISSVGQVYADPIIEEEDKEQEDLEQYRRDFPLCGLCDSDQPLALKNWLNTAALAGTTTTTTTTDAAGPYGPAQESMPEDYIQEHKEDTIPYMGGNIPTPSDTTGPLTNWLNMDALAGTATATADPVYAKPVELEEKAELEVDVGPFRVPVPLPGIDAKAVRLKNWLNASPLPGVAAEQPNPSVYDNAGEVMSDYVEIQEDIQDEHKALSGTAVTADDVPPLTNWLSLSALPGIQGSIYGEPKEWNPEDYVQPPSPDMVGEAKLSAILSAEEEDQRCRDRSCTDETCASSSSSTSHADGSMSPQNGATWKHDNLPMNWPALAEMVEQKEE